MGRMRGLFSKIRQSWKSFGSRNPGVAWTVSSLKWLPLGIVVTQNVATIKMVTGKSMMPTLNPDDSAWRDVVVFDRWTVRVEQKYERGDIVAVRSPDDTKLLVKRIIALPGDVVQTLPPYPDREVRIPEGHVWIEGDESFHTEDSSYFGPVPLALVDSKLSFIVWPPERIGPLELPVPPKANAPRGPAWRKEMNAVARARRREERVTVASHKP